MNWYLIHTKPKQEKWALQNLEQQGFECYLPVLPTEKISQGKLDMVDEPLFPRYLFIRLDRDASARSWSPIRSTKGVSRLVTFGVEPAKIDDQLVDMLKARERAVESQPHRLFSPGERLRFLNGPFAGIDGIYQMADGESRVIVLIELLNKAIKIRVSPTHLSKAG